MPYAALVPRVNIFREVAVKNKTGFERASSTYEKTLKSDHKKKPVHAQFREIWPEFKIKQRTTCELGWFYRN